MADRDPLLDSREGSYGDFKVQGEWATQMKARFRGTPNWDRLAYGQAESIDMIITKLSRILHGSPRVKDSWKDIAGYAKLGEEACD